MTKHEYRMTNHGKRSSYSLKAFRSFDFRHSFVIRHSDFVILAT